MDGELAKLLSAVDEIEKSEDKQFIDKTSAKQVVAGKEKNELKETLQLRETKIEVAKKGNQESKTIIRAEADKVWIDPSLGEWPENDYRIMVRNIPSSATEKDLIDTFSNLKSLYKTKIIRDSSGRNKNYGFVSLLDVNDYIEAMTKMQKTFVGKKRVLLEPSNWKDRNLKTKK